MLQYIKKKNQKHQVIPLQIEEEQEFHLQKQQDQFKGFAIDIKQTNKQLKEDMKVLQETSKQLMEQIQNLGYVQIISYSKFIQNQNSDVELKLKQVGQMLSIITEELQSENKKDVQQTNKSVIRIDQFFQDSKVNSPNPYVDYNSTALNQLDYECFIDSFL
ncbi:unnamed protein product [Paramecium sonneborni]|uniref:Uncharacterized protein n=1 Tax=Paramecium sonneborni TaxID=65129 RepID=A0A8S1K021_9CILI|nr:unnamed protein product [Paramecium sonneborni]